MDAAKVAFRMNAEKIRQTPQRDHAPDVYWPISVRRETTRVVAARPESASEQHYVFGRDVCYASGGAGNDKRSNSVRFFARSRAMEIPMTTRIPSSATSPRNCPIANAEEGGGNTMVTPSTNRARISSIYIVTSGSMMARNRSTSIRAGSLNDRQVCRSSLDMRAVIGYHSPTNWHSSAGTDSPGPCVIVQTR